MRIIITTILILFIFGCSNKPNTELVLSENIKEDILSQETTMIFNEPENWQKDFRLTHDPDKDSVWGKPVIYYLSDKNCSKLAKDFYYGKLRPSDNEMTADLLILVTTSNNKLRPFYRWCLNKTILIQDGALGEYTGLPARKYAEKYPREFFEYMDIDTTGEKYNDWVNAIKYSGFYETEDYNKPNEIIQNMTKSMRLNCKNCDKKLLSRIEKFANECFR